MTERIMNKLSSVMRELSSLRNEVKIINIKLNHMMTGPNLHPHDEDHHVIIYRMPDAKYTNNLYDIYIGDEYNVIDQNWIICSFNKKKHKNRILNALDLSLISIVEEQLWIHKEWDIDRFIKAIEK